ncbi:MAG TPA: hypothetical protein VHI52_08000 [Verrucomicrobiae bacterium]|nr:hypothetical protein [Verrucomicrobiae bacterium]
MGAIHSLRDKFGGSTLFGNEKDESFQGSLAAIYQTFGGVDLYPSVEEKAANLLYPKAAGAAIHSILCKNCTS